MSALIAIFYGCYIFFLQKETFFNANRWFLLAGLITALLFPFMIIPIYLDIPATTSSGFTMIATTVQTRPEASFNVSTLLLCIYALGASFFFGRLLLQFFSLTILIKNNNKEKFGKYNYVKTSQNITPFSFFKWIVFNPKLFNEEELELILEHEKIHASQLHSMDAVLIDLATALFWFNPFIWLYKKALKQNLEFIADHHTQKQTDCEERYQMLLLKTSLPEQNLTVINTFYNSSIRLKVFGKPITLFTAFGQVKKRIVMLHKSKSNLMNTWKYSIIVPLLAIFAMTFNTETIAQTSVNPTESPKHDQQNILKFVVTKDTKDQQLDFIKDKLSENGAIITFKNIKRNSKNEIIGIKVAYNHENSKLVHSKKLSEPIKSIEISMNSNNGKINMGEQTHTLSQTFKVETDKNEQSVLEKTTHNQDDSYHVIYKKVDKDGTIKDSIFMERTTEKVNWTNVQGDKVEVLSVKKTNKESRIFKNDENSPLVLFDGKEINNDKMNSIDPNSIDNIQVLKDNAITKKYGDKGKNGVILITSKTNGISKTEDQSIITTTKDENQKSISISKNGIRPLYLIDGKEISKEEMEAIDPNTIESVDVLKDESVTKKYGKKGENGVIMITTKKK